jgi:predicted 2-oxoglutarate/Fe(II)-dependent dioxygenase YbiX
MLPSDSQGGALVVEHGGKSTTYRPSKTSLSFVAFYADCRHEVRPVTSGYRVVLSYNVRLDGDTAASVTARVDGSTVQRLAGLLDEHFSTRVAARYGGADRDPPTRLVYLLDH